MYTHTYIHTHTHIYTYMHTHIHNIYIYTYMLHITYMYFSSWKVEWGHEIPLKIGFSPNFNNKYKYRHLHAVCL